MSALLGQTPISYDDELIYRGLLILSPSQINPNESLPFGPPAPSPPPDEDRSRTLLIGEAFAIFFALAFTISRLIVRKYYTRCFGIDDWLIIPGCLGCITYLGLAMVEETVGRFGKHIWECTYSSLATYVELVRTSESIFYFTVMCTKLSIAFGNRRITGISSKNWQIVHWIFIATFLCLMPTLTLIDILQCRPVRASYSLPYLASMEDPRQVKCISRRAFSLTARSLHILTDCALLCVPIFIIVQLQMPLSRKCRLSAIFAVGGMSTIASIVRNVLIDNPMEDATWQLYQVYIWNIIDITFAVIVSSLPALNAIVDRTIKRARTNALGDRSSPRRLLSRIKTYVSLHTRRSSSKAYVDDSENSDVITLCGDQWSKPKPDPDGDHGQQREFQVLEIFQHTTGFGTEKLRNQVR